jgi:hypothetical protein
VFVENRFLLRAAWPLGAACAHSYDTFAHGLIRIVLVHGHHGSTCSAAMLNFASHTLLPIHPQLDRPFS